MNSVGCLYATAMYSHFVPNSRQISHRQSLFFAYIFKYPVRHLRETILEIGTSQQLFLLLCKLLYDVTTTTVFSAATAARNCQHRHSLVPGHEYKLLPTLEKLLIGIFFSNVSCNSLKKFIAIPDARLLATMAKVGYPKVAIQDILRFFFYLKEVEKTRSSRSGCPPFFLLQELQDFGIVSKFQPSQNKKELVLEFSSPQKKS